jgi:hypothetical protein
MWHVWQTEGVREFFWLGNLIEGDDSGNPDGRTIVRFQEVRYGVMDWSSWLRIGTGGELFECDNEPSRSIQFGESID